MNALGSTNTKEQPASAASTAAQSSNKEEHEAQPVSVAMTVTATFEGERVNAERASVALTVALTPNEAENSNSEEQQAPVTVTVTPAPDSEETELVHSDLGEETVPSLTTASDGDDTESLSSSFERLMETTTMLGSANNVENTNSFPSHLMEDLPSGVTLTADDVARLSQPAPAPNAAASTSRRPVQTGEASSSNANGLLWNADGTVVEPHWSTFINNTEGWDTDNTAVESDEVYVGHRVEAGASTACSRAREAIARERSAWDNIHEEPDWNMFRGSRAPRNRATVTRPATPMPAMSSMPVTARGQSVNPAANEPVVAPRLSIVRRISRWFRTHVRLPRGRGRRG